MLASDGELSCFRKSDAGNGQAGHAIFNPRGEVLTKGHKKTELCQLTSTPKARETPDSKAQAVRAKLPTPEFPTKDGSHTPKSLAALFRCLVLRGPACGTECGPNPRLNSAVAWCARDYLGIGASWNGLETR